MYDIVAMTQFRESFIHHLAASGLKVSQVAAATGVSDQQLHKLKQRRAGTTNVEDAVKIARFFGKTLEEFLDEPENVQVSDVLALLNRLSEDEKAILVAQIEGLVASRHLPVK